MPRKAPVAATSAAPKATAAAATWRSTTQGELPLAATAPPRAIATSRSARAAEVRRTSLRYAHRATITFATSSGSATAASPQCTACSRSAAVVTTSPVAPAAPTTETRKTTPGVAGSGDSSGPIGLTQPLAEIVQRSGARHVRDGVEVVRRRRRRRVPLQRVRRADAGGATDHEDGGKADRLEHRRVEVEVPAPERREPVEDLDARRHGNRHRRDHEEGVQRVRKPDREHVVRPHEHRDEADPDGRERDRLVAEDRLSGEHREHLRTDSERGQHHDVDLGVAEEPERVLPEERRTPPGGGEEVRLDVPAAD